MSIKLWNTSTYPEILPALTQISGPNAYRNSKLNSMLIGLLAEESIAAYHATRVLSVDKLVSEGIRPGSINEMRNEIVMYLDTLGMSKNEIESAMAAIEKSAFNRDKGSENAKAYFASNPFNDDGFYDYCSTVGGEIVLKACEYNPKLEILKEIGTPVICEVSFILEELDDRDKQAFIQGMCAIVEQPLKRNTFNTLCATNRAKPIRKVMDLTSLLKNENKAQVADAIRNYFDAE